MRSFVALTTLFLLVAAVGCGGTPSGTSPSSVASDGSQPRAASDASQSSETVSGIPVRRGRKWRNGREEATPPLTALDMEAAKEALDRWNLTRIGDGESHYVCERFRSAKTGSAPPLPKAVAEMRKVSVEVTPHDINEADKLNGKEWSGHVQLCYEVVRTYPQVKFWRVDSEYHPNDEGWSQWRIQSQNPGGPDVDFGLGADEHFEFYVDPTRVNGNWQFPTAKYKREKVQPSDLPK